nr:hypothetical protein [uncultured Campylobacter sp.]
MQPITSEWLTPELDGLIYDQFGSALGRLSGVEHVSFAISRPFYRRARY